MRGKTGLVFKDTDKVIRAYHSVFRQFLYGDVICKMFIDIGNAFFDGLGMIIYVCLDRIEQEESGQYVRKLFGEQSFPDLGSVFKSFINLLHFENSGQGICKGENIAKMGSYQAVIRSGHRPVEMHPQAFPS